MAGGFTIDDFTVDEQAGTVTCPNGVARHITKGRKVSFGAPGYRLSITFSA